MLRFHKLTATVTIVAFGALMFTLAAPAPAHAQWGKIKKKLLKKKKDSGGLSDSRIADGLKEALRIGTDNTVKETGREDGYFGNDIIRIIMPEKMKKIDRALRAIGQDDMMDEFILSMNRAAEAAAPKAKDIFWDAILEMNFSDVRKIWKGGDTAATDFFRDKTTDELTEIFRPIIKDALDKVGATRNYEKIAKRGRKIPFLKAELVELDEYVVEKALVGLFHILGEEEKKIRKDPAARVTDLLKDVFSGIASN